ncbi:hypothetical protein PGTUg99_007947 [Puccinia graminis f. sp. tritici]|uniref:Uncharacterized protein n=1 Tax=Puccinia graminis f. sp. tritici TaxID=56615 RepID=A0A5B0SH50_PUCGR|nr:hypothetical protein PGTUg99_007947 [Puccinia graminis f. sp. tritici]
MENKTAINSHLFDLFRHAPVGSNPFTFALLDLQNQEKPVSGVLIRYALTGFSGIYAMVYDKPYWIINNGLMIGVSYLISGLMFQGFVAQYLSTMDSPRQTFIFSWIDVFKLPGSCATYIQAFTMLFISASNPSTRGGDKKYSMSPAVFNCLLIGFPAFITLAEIFLISHKASLFHKHNISFDALIKLLHDAANQWDGGHKIPTDSQKDLLQTAFENVTRDAYLKTQSAIRIGMLWSLTDITPILIYIGGVSALVTTAYQPDRTARKVNTMDLDQTPPPEMFGSAPIKLDTESSNPLARSLRYLWFHYLAMSSALCWDLAAGMTFYVNREHLNDVRLGPIFLVLNLGTSLSTLVGIIILLARIIGDGKESKTDGNQSNEFIRSRTSSITKLMGRKE